MSDDDNLLCLALSWTTLILTSFSHGTDKREASSSEPAYIRKLSQIPLIAYILVLAMCTLHATVSAFVKSVDTMDSWQIASHREGATCIPLPQTPQGDPM